MKKYISQNISKSYIYSKNPYPLLYIDLLSECNMNCNICYNSNLPPAILSIEDYEELVSSIPHKVFVRLLGGEPTIHPNFFEFIEISRKYGHYVTVSSNGLMYSNDDFIAKLSKKTYNNRACGYGITLNGGLNPNNEMYSIIDNDQSSGAIKIEGLKKLINSGIRNIGLTAIIVRGMNEHVIGELYDLAKQHSNVTNLKFRSVGLQLGNKVPNVPYTSKEFRDHLFPQFFDMDKVNMLCDGESDKRCALCCYEFKIDGISVKHIEFGTEGANKCWKRGFVDFKERLIYPFFEYETLKSEFYGE